jgi:glycosyltransferase involved in cell wall biosynthesis
VTGFLAEKQNPGALAEKIRLLLDDSSLRLKMGQEGYKRFLGNYTIDRFEYNICETIKTILMKRV